MNFCYWVINLHLYEGGQIIRLSGPVYSSRKMSTKQHHVSIACRERRFSLYLLTIKTRTPMLMEQKTAPAKYKRIEFASDLRIKIRHCSLLTKSFLSINILFLLLIYIFNTNILFIIQIARVINKQKGSP